jgi:hypothetical protein
MDRLDGFEIDLNLDFFDFTLEPMDIESRYIKPKIHRDIPEKQLLYEYAEELAKDIDLENRTYCILSGSFIFGDFIEALIYEHDLMVDYMAISTLSYCKKNIDSLCGMLNSGRIKKLDLIISKFFYNIERNNLIKYTYQRLDVDNRFQMAVAGIHTKTCIFKTECDKYIVMYGSSNLRSSNSIEQVMIENNKELYEFNYEYQKDIIDKYATIDKIQDGKELWRNLTVREVDKLQKPKDYQKQHEQE